MVLSDNDILNAVENDQIVITPFDKKKLNPNSYNLTLHDTLLIYRETGKPLNPRIPNPTQKMIIPPTGRILTPGILYLGRTNEYTETHDYVPMLEGRSSLARLGISVHTTAGFGDHGFKGFWTLEISVIQPVRIYADIDVCQIYYHTILSKGSVYKGKYQNNKGLQASLAYKDKR